MEYFDITEWDHAVTYLEERAGQTMKRSHYQMLTMQFPEHVAELSDRIDELAIELVGLMTE